MSSQKHGEKERGQDRTFREKDMAVKTELMGGGRRKVPPKIWASAIGGLVLCVAIIVIVVVAVRMMQG